LRPESALRLDHRCVLRECEASAATSYVDRSVVATGRGVLRLSSSISADI